MPRRCLVPACPDPYATNPHSMVHCFPSDEVLRAVWTMKTGVSSLNDSDQTIENCGVCTYHFDQNDYKHLPNEERRGQLLKFAVPCLNLPNVELENASVSLSAPSIIRICDTLLQQEKELKKLAQLINTTKAKLKESKTKTQDLAASVKTVGSLEKNCNKLKEELKRFQESSNKEFKLRHRNQVYEEFGNMFTKNMIDMVLDKSQLKKWKDVDMALAISIFSSSSACYRFLRESCKYPLPCVSTIYDRFSRIDIQPGILHPVMNLLQKEFKNLTPMQKIGILSFDEMFIDGRLSYDEKHDRVLGPHKNMMAITVRGLHCNWKQLIYVNFDDRITNVKILEITSQLYHRGITVAGMVSDMAKVNTRVWNELGLHIQSGRYFFDHPITNEPVWVFADFPHLIKRLRCNFLDYDIRLGEDFENAVISVNAIKELLRLQENSDLRLTFKLTEKHIYMTKRERMNVRTAMELFSERTAKAIEFLLPQYPQMAKFFKLVSDASKILNTRTKVCGDDHPCSCPYGLHEEEQDKVLKKFVKNITEMRVLNARPSLLPFQNGFKLTCGSLRGLLVRMKRSPVNAKLIMTNHINQDHLESTFGALRGISRYNDLPTPIDALSRVKKLLICSNIQRPTTGNVNVENSLEYVSGRSGSLTIMMSGARPEPEPTPVFDSDFYEHKFGHIDITDIRLISFEALSSTEKSSVGSAEFLAGFIARKFMDQHHEMIMLGRRHQGWITVLSRSNLVTPSTFWLSMFLKFEEFFKKFHERQRNNQWDVNKDPSVVATLQVYICRAFPEIEEKIVKFYVRLRTKIRINAINKKIWNIRKRKRARDLLTTLLVEQDVAETEQEDAAQDHENDIDDEALDEIEAALNEDQEEEELLDI